MTDVRGEVLRRLNELNIPFELIEHDMVHSMEDCLAPAEALHGLMPRNLLLTPRSRSAFYLAILRPNAPFRTSFVSKQAGSSRLSFATEEDLMHFMHVLPGALTPMSFLFEEANDVRLLMDSALRKEQRLVFHPCVGNASLAMSGADFFDRFLPATGHDVTWIEVTP